MCHIVKKAPIILIVLKRVGKVYKIVPIARVLINPPPRLKMKAGPRKVPFNDVRI